MADRFHPFNAGVSFTLILWATKDGNLLVFAIAATSFFISIRKTLHG